MRELRDPEIITLLVPADCTDGFGRARWRRAEAYLDPRARRPRGLALLDQELVASAMIRLRADLGSGRWHERNAQLLELDAIHHGYRLVVVGGRWLTTWQCRGRTQCR